MKVNRVTLSAFGTTGVLLAASLTMLAMVSALVTFDAWPTRNGGAIANDVAIQRAPEARVVRAVRRVRATTGAAASASGSGGATAQGAAGGSAGGATGAGGGGSGAPSGPGGAPNGPTPQVPQSPPGEDPGGTPSVQPPQPQPGAVQDVVSRASKTVCGVASVGC
jgi:hypothetical protein